MTNLLVIFRRKTEDIHDENYINYCHVPNRKYNSKLKFLVLPKIILQKSDNASKRKYEIQI
jgi:hypothetical protein